MLDPREAWNRLRSTLAPSPSELVSRRRAAGRVLAESLTATVDVPAHDVSAMDGFALAGSPRPGEDLPVTGRVVAGDPPGFELPPNSATRIMTGAPVPAAADTVIPVELTETREDAAGERVQFHETVETGANVRLQGEVLRIGDPLLPAGTPLTPQALSLLATHGVADVPVHRLPRMAILATGDEVVPPESTPQPGQLRNSNTDYLLAAGSALGLEPISLGIAPDEPETLRRMLEEGLERSDVLFVTGGVSMGELDFVGSALLELGYETLFEKVAVQPGKPLVVAVSGDVDRTDRARWVFGLPGNPASVMVTFRLFAQPALRILSGFHGGYLEGLLAGVLEAPLRGAKGRDRFLPASTRIEDGRFWVTPHPPRGSHDLAAYGVGNTLVRVPARAEPTDAGDACEILLLGDAGVG